MALASISYKFKLEKVKQTFKNESIPSFLKIDPTVFTFQAFEKNRQIKIILNSSSTNTVSYLPLCILSLIA